MSVSGKYMTCKIGTTVIFDNYAWTVDENNKELDRTTGAFNGFGAEDLGIQRARIAIKGYMDVSLGQYTVVSTNTIITNLNLYRDENDTTPAYNFPTAKVFKSSQGGEVDGKIEWTSSINSYGDYTINDPT
jgi:hypothetical protein